MGLTEPIRNLNDLLKVEKILSENKRNHLLFCVGINFGLRISDILALNVSDVKNKNYIQIVEKKTTKFKKFPINSKLKKLIADFTKQMPMSDPLFKSVNNNRLDRFRVYHILKDACAKAGLDVKIGTHTLRKTFGYHHYKKFKDVAMLQKIFNHSTPAITLRYIGIEQEEIFESYRNFIL